MRKRIGASKKSSWTHTNLTNQNRSRLFFSELDHVDVGECVTFSELSNTHSILPSSVSPLFFNVYFPWKISLAARYFTRTRILRDLAKLKTKCVFFGDCFSVLNCRKIRKNWLKFESWTRVLWIYYMKYIHVCNFVTVIVYKINSMFSIKQLFSYLPCTSIRQYNSFIYRQCATVSIASDMMVNVTSNRKSKVLFLQSTHFNICPLWKILCFHLCGIWDIVKRWYDMIWWRANRAEVGCVLSPEARRRSAAGPPRTSQPPVVREDSADSESLVENPPTSLFYHIPYFFIPP